MTAAAHAGFLTRAQLGLIAPRSVSRNVAPERGGVALHHGGDTVPITSHAGCLATWRGWQRFHMGRYYTPNPDPAGRHWVDLAYSLGVCQHGWVLAGRGYGVRTAANGTNDGNYRYLAICWLGGARQTPTAAALGAIAWAVAELRRLGAGADVVGHRDLNPSTSCPHPRLRQLATELHRRPIATQEAEMPLNSQDLAAVRQIVREQVVEALGGDRITWTPSGEDTQRRGNQGIINSVWWANTRATGGHGTVLQVLSRAVDTSAAILAALDGLPGEVGDEVARKVAGGLQLDYDELAAAIGHPPTAREIVDEHARRLAAEG